MINPNGDDFIEDDPLAASMKPEEEPISPKAKGRSRRPLGKASTGGEPWVPATKTRSARERTEFLLRENPVPTVLGALAVGLAIGLAIRYASSSEEKKAAIHTPLGDINWNILSLPFLWPFFKSVRNRYEDSAEAVKEGVGRIKGVDVDRYVKPLRKKWRAWTD